MVWNFWCQPLQKINSKKNALIQSNVTGYSQWIKTGFSLKEGLLGHHMYITHTHLHKSFCSYRVYSPLGDTQLKDNILPSSAKTGHYCSVTGACPAKIPCLSVCLQEVLWTPFYPPNSSPCWHWQKLHTIQIISQPSSWFHGLAVFPCLIQNPQRDPCILEPTWKCSLLCLCTVCAEDHCDSVYVIQYASARPVLFCFGSNYAPTSTILKSK